MNTEQMWARLAEFQPFADRNGFGETWKRMIAERTTLATWAAAGAAAGNAQTANVVSKAAHAAVVVVQVASDAEREGTR